MTHLLTIPDVADRLKISTGKARQLVLTLAHVRVGRLLRLQEEVLTKYLARGGDEGWVRQKAHVREVTGCSSERVQSTKVYGPKKQTADESVFCVQNSLTPAIVPRKGHGKKSRKTDRTNRT